MDNLTKVHIIVPVFNRVNITREYVHRIRLQTYPSIHLYLVDDASPDCTAEIVSNDHTDWTDLSIINSGGNAWWGGGIHAGMKQARMTAKENDVMLLMNDDVMFDNQLVEMLVSAHNEKPNAILSAIPVRNGRISGLGSNMLIWPLALTTRPYANAKWPDSKLPAFIPVQFQFAHAILYPVRIVDTIGEVAWRELPHYHGDGEYSWRAVRNGFESYVVTSIPIFTKSGSTGLFNCSETRYSWRQLFRSFFEFKSINNLRHRWEFAKLAAPRFWLYPYFLSHIAKSFLRSVFMILRHPS